MPWTAAGAAALAEMGVHWVRVADAGEPLPQADLAQAADAAGSAAVSAPGPRADVEPIRTAVAPRAGVEHRPVPGGAGAAGGLDWEPLREAVRQCRACGLCETRKQTGEVPPDAYLTADQKTAAIQQALATHRWVFTVDGLAIFDRPAPACQE